uniref:Probable pectate lyase F n=1 Tax=Ditylenchus dipsaci TaxID=166011 RepID=A0A915DNY9_9BILA
MRLVAGPLVGGSSVNEKDSPILFLEPGITISNVIIGSPAAKGIWCKGSCTLQNVWWESVGTHAANFGVDPLYWSNTGNKYIIEGGGVQNAVEKAYQGTNDYSGGSGTGPKPTPTESITVGSPLNGTTCKDPSANRYYQLTNVILRMFVNIKIFNLNAV